MKDICEVNYFINTVNNNTYSASIADWGTTLKRDTAAGVRQIIVQYQSNRLPHTYTINILHFHKVSRRNHLTTTTFKNSWGVVCEQTLIFHIFSGQCKSGRKKNNTNYKVQIGTHHMHNNNYNNPHSKRSVLRNSWQQRLHSSTKSKCRAVVHKCPRLPERCVCIQMLVDIQNLYKVKTCILFYHS